MNGFVGFMQSWVGRLLRVVAGLALPARPTVRLHRVRSATHSAHVEVVTRR